MGAQGIKAKFLFGKYQETKLRIIRRGGLVYKLALSIVHIKCDTDMDLKVNLIRDLIMFRTVLEGLCMSYIAALFLSITTGVKTLLLI